MAPFWHIGSAGALPLGYAGVVRSVGSPCAAVLVVYIRARRVGWRARSGGVLPAFGAGQGRYMALVDAQHGRFGMTQWGSRYLYARVATFADCATLRGWPAAWPTSSSRATASAAMTIPVVWELPTTPARPAYPGYRGPSPPSAPSGMSIDPSRYVDAIVGRPPPAAAFAGAGLLRRRAV